MTDQVWWDESVSKENWKNDGYLSPENIGPASAIEVRSEIIERRVWKSGYLLGTCVIFCKGFPLWNLVAVVIGLRVYGI